MKISSTCKSSVSTNRLLHSPEGEYNSCVRMSSEQMFIFIEGPKDDIFYKSICECALKDLGITYKVKYGHGKKRMLDIFSYLESKNKLSTVFDSTKKAFFFFLDKDVDDLTNKLIKNEHISYTEHHSVENYYFLYGDLAKSISFSIGLHISSINDSALRDNNSWTYNVAEKWKEWVELCLLAALKIPECKNYHSYRSAIHKSLDESIDQRRKAKMEWKLLKKANIAKQEFDKIKLDAQNLVNQQYVSGQHSKIFKGKWYCGFLCNDAEKIAQIHGVYSKRSKKHLSELLVSHLVSSLCYDDQWANVFKLPIRKIAEKLI